MKKDFLSLKDFTPEELLDIIKYALILKQERANGTAHNFLKNKKVALIFEKPSTRTRVSFEVGVYELGGYPLFLNSNDIQLGRGESIGDTAKILSRYVDMIMIRTFEHEKIVEMASQASVPVINGLTDKFHPCQIMADVMTLYEKAKKIKGLNIAFIGDINNVAMSWLHAAGKLGMNISIASPEGYNCNASVLEDAKKMADVSGGVIQITKDPFQAVKGADVVYTDVWVSMGMEEESAKRREVFRNYQVNKDLMDAAGKKTYFMHCLPVHIDEEVTKEVYESENSIVFDQAENRLHVQKAIMALLIKY